ncbi:6887_t:CDS:2 [Gigaspora margarita]|uniref:6887_t:CDS:1 n=1 Tax=Gigaspora margarita TaxID=4874 RepID=A0ABM8VY14_GIGMA|nr:6887_t:CDS:2 [Gigaspora margarita]
MPLSSSLLIGNNHVVPNWNDQVADWSGKLWLPFEDLSSLKRSNNGSCKIHNGKRKKVQTTRRAKRTKKAPLTRSIKIQVYPNALQKNLLKQWIGCARLVYNMVVANYMLKILARDEVIQCNNELQSQVNPEYPRYKPNNIKPPLHHEHQRKNNSWPNQEGKVMLDSKLSYNKKLRQWTFIWVYVGHGNIGDNDINHIFHLGLALDDLISRTIKAPAKKM